MKRWGWLAALCAVSGAPLAAQDAPQQTVEGAQRFLSLVASEQKPRFMAHYFVWPTAGVEYTIDGATAGNCSTTFTGQPYGYSRRSTVGSWVMVGQPGWSPQIFETVRANNGMPKMPVTVDWSRVIKISLASTVANPDEGIRHNVLITWAGGFITLDPADDALAKRIEYAANFLKAACDKTAETGF
jgi:hypothetical protein